MNTVADEWSRFGARLHGSATDSQRRDLQTAFYAGAAAILRIQTGLSVLSEEAKGAVVGGLFEELAMYAYEIGSPPPLEGQPVETVNQKKATSQ